MIVDAESLFDLEIVEALGRSASLAPWIGPARTTDGAAELRRLVASPLSALPAIRARQRNLQTIRVCDVTVRWEEVAPLLREVRRYLDSNYVELPETTLGCLVASIFHPEHAAEVARGLGALAQLEVHTRRIAGLLQQNSDDSTAHDDDIVQNLRTALRNFIDAPLLRSLRNAEGRRAFRLPRLIRLDAGVRLRLREVLERVLTAWATLDALGCLSELLGRPGFSVPTLVDPPQPLELLGLFHPQLAHPVRNDVTLHADTRVIILTGPNMAGKSTFLKALGISVLLAHLGTAVPAANATIPIQRRLTANLSAKDSIAESQSLFLAEARRVRSVLSQLQRDGRVFVLIDEPFRGTNVPDAMEATALLIKGLAAAPQAFAVIATHFGELAGSFAPSDVRIARASFQGSRTDNTWSFDYKLQPGISTQRLGMYLLEREGVLALLDDILRAGEAGAPQPFA